MFTVYGGWVVSGFRVPGFWGIGRLSRFKV